MKILLGEVFKGLRVKMFEYQDLVVIVQLAILEGLLSFDNALALAALVNKRLTDPKLQKKALIYGLWGAYIFRFVLIFIGVWLFQYEFIKLLAGSYLIYLFLSECFFKHKTKSDKNQEIIEAPKKISYRKIFWLSVLNVEIMDLMFSIDSVAVALAISSKPYVLILGALFGIFMMRIAAQFFIVLIKKFPLLEKAAFVMVGLAGVNIVLKIRDLNVFGYWTFSINRPMPESLFLTLMISILILAMVMSKFLTHQNKNAK